MLLEKVKFLEEAIRTSGSEILEELEALSEAFENGENPKDNISFITSIVKDLLESSENYEEFKDEGELDEEELVEENIEEKQTEEDIEVVSYRDLMRRFIEERTITSRTSFLPDWTSEAKTKDVEKKPEVPAEKEEKSRFHFKKDESVIIRFPHFIMEPEEDLFKIFPSISKEEFSSRPMSIKHFSGTVAEHAQSPFLRTQNIYAIQVGEKYLIVPEKALRKA